MGGPKIISTLLSMPLILAFFWHAETCESKTRSLSNMDPKKVALGKWGGEHIRVEVTEKGARIEYDCAHGTIDRRLLTDKRNHFEVEGLHFQERGGPLRADSVERGEPAIYQGTTDGQTMTLTVTLKQTRETIGTFTLKHGKAVRLMKCK